MGDTPFRSWLRKPPQPHSLRVDGKPLLISNHASKWSEAERSVMVMNPQTVEALDRQGNVLRAYPFTDPEAPLEKAPQREAWPDAAEAQMAQVITASNDRAVSRYVDFVRLSFGQLTQLFQDLQARYEAECRRNAHLEAALQRALEERGQPAPTDEEGMFAQVAALVTQRLLQEGVGHPPNGKDDKQ